MLNSKMYLKYLKVFKFKEFELIMFWKENIATV